MRDIQNYCIKTSYLPNTPKDGIMSIGNDTIEESLCSQYSVYVVARRLLKKNNLNNVLDIGCGVGMKLHKLISPICNDITGLDEPNTIYKCKELYDFGHWYGVNIEHDDIDLTRKFDLIISSDVIEHLINPDALISIIKRHSHSNTLIVLSTVDRDMARGMNHNGPPPNIGHCREWNYCEFREYIENHDFHILEHLHCDSVYRSTLQKLRHSLSYMLQILRGMPNSHGSTQLIVMKWGILDE